MSLLKQEYKDGEMSIKDTLALAVKVLSKTLDMTKLTSEKGQFFAQLVKDSFYLQHRIIFGINT